MDSEFATKHRCRVKRRGSTVQSRYKSNVTEHLGSEDGGLGTLSYAVIANIRYQANTLNQKKTIQNKMLIVCWSMQEIGHRSYLVQSRTQRRRSSSSHWVNTRTRCDRAGRCGNRSVTGKGGARWSGRTSVSSPAARWCRTS